MDCDPTSSRKDRTALLGRRNVEISAHAVDRFQQRVNRAAPRQAAFAAIAEMLAHGCVRARGRKWTEIDLVPGTRLVYSAVQPDACLIVRDGTVVTVITRELSARRRQGFKDVVSRRPSRSRARRFCDHDPDWRQEALAA